VFESTGAALTGFTEQSPSAVITHSPKVYLVVRMIISSVCLPGCFAREQNIPFARLL
jgi:hypothetical protein